MINLVCIASIKTQFSVHLPLSHIINILSNSALSHTPSLLPVTYTPLIWLLDRQHHHGGAAAAAAAASTQWVNANADADGNIRQNGRNNGMVYGIKIGNNSMAW